MKIKYIIHFPKKIKNIKRKIWIKITKENSPLIFIENIKKRKNKFSSLPFHGFYPTQKLRSIFFFLFGQIFWRVINKLLTLFINNREAKKANFLFDNFQWGKKVNKIKDHFIVDFKPINLITFMNPNFIFLTEHYNVI